MQRELGANNLRKEPAQTYILGMETKAAKSFRFEMRVTYSDCTLGNHVYYSRYLNFLEAARGEFHRKIGFPLIELQGQDTIFPVVECALKYLKPARYDDVLQIELCVSNLSAVRLAYQYEIRRGGEVLLAGQTRHVCTSIGEKPKKIPEELAVQLTQFLRDPLEI